MDLLLLATYLLHLGMVAAAAVAAVVQHTMMGTAGAGGRGSVGQQLDMWMYPAALNET